MNNRINTNINAVNLTTGTRSSSSSNNYTSNNTSSNINSIKPNHSMPIEIEEISFEDTNVPVDIKNISENKKVTVSTLDESGEQIDIEITLGDLESFGFTETDINKLISGQISLNSLMEEIENDPKGERRRLITEAAYMKEFNLDFNNLDELNDAIELNRFKIKELLKLKEAIKNNELEATMQVVNRLRNGENLEDILATEVVAWKYYDENGNICYSNEEPYFKENYDGNGYEAMYYENMYGNSDLYEELKDILIEEENQLLAGGSYTVHRWSGTEEQTLYFEKISNDYLEYQQKLEEIDNQILELQKEQNDYQNIYNYVENITSYYFDNIDPYIKQNDFSENAYFNGSCLDSVNSVKDQYSNLNYNGYEESEVESINVDRATALDIIACMINKKGSIDNGRFLVGNHIYEFATTDNSMLENYAKWAKYIDPNEVAVFNYIYNTEGEDSAYDYLERISYELDNRWLVNTRKEDQDFASEHPYLATLGSFIFSPIEGISATCYSLNALFNDEKIRRVQVYSASDVWRGQVSTDIAQDHGKFWSSAYNIGMSMGDSAMLLGLTVATGGTATPVLSAGIMGSKAYVSTLNDALDRGLTDEQAVLLASSSALVETAMESYSVGHLLNLETHLGETTTTMLNKIAQISNPKIASITTKTAYCLASAFNQGFCNAEEELATEALNSIFDRLISGDLSQHSLAINDYMNKGYTEEEARSLANQDYIGRFTEAGLSGFFSGLFFGSFSGFKTTNNVSNYIANNTIAQFEGNEAQLFASIIENNRNQQISLNEQQRNINKANLLNFFDNIKNFFTSNSNNLGGNNQVHTETQNLQEITDFETLTQILGGEYNLGVHGVDGTNIWQKVDDEYQLNMVAADEIKDSIMSDGLRIQGNRKLLSTVRFSNLADYLTEGYYDAGGVIIALPNQLRNANGETIDLGTVNESNANDRNYATTSLAEDVLPTYGSDSGLLDPMFILGKYEKMDAGQIRITTNPNHIYFNDGIVPTEFFDSIRTRINSNNPNPINITDTSNETIPQINLKRDELLQSLCTKIYGVDQAATSNLIKIGLRSLNWIKKETDFLNYLETKFGYSKKYAKIVLDHMKNKSKKNQYIDTSINNIFEYIFDELNRDGSFNIIDKIDENFVIKPSSEGERIINKLVRTGTSKLDAIRILYTIDSRGACAYGTIANSIMMSYAKNQQAFEKTFGYPFYTTINGYKELNGAEFLLDLYTYINSRDYNFSDSEPLFNIDENGKITINHLEVNKQVGFRSTDMKTEERIITDFLQSKSPNLKYSILQRSLYDPKSFLLATKEMMGLEIEKIATVFNSSENEHINIGLYGTEKKEIRLMINPDTVQQSISPGGAHRVYVTGIENEYFIVSTWSGRYLIPIVDLLYNCFSVSSIRIEGIE